MVSLRDFSAGYYRGYLHIERHDGEHPVMAREQLREANELIYTSGKGIERLNHPVVVKVDESYFPVLGGDDVPPDTLAVPERVLEAIDIKKVPTMKEVLIAKADHAGPLLEWFTPYTVAKPDFA